MTDDEKTDDEFVMAVEAFIIDEVRHHAKDFDPGSVEDTVELQELAEKFAQICLSARKGEWKP